MKQNLKLKKIMKHIINKNFGEEQKIYFFKNRNLFIKRVLKNFQTIRKL